MKQQKTPLEILVKYQEELKEKIIAIELDAHWFRRVFHAFAASFLFYYLLPDDLWSILIKIYVPIIIVSAIAILEYRRITGEIDHQHFFGLRGYEKGRAASYLYFGMGLLLLFLFFPQQIAIPCLLCASFTDPVIGELRYYWGKKRAYLIGFLVSLFIFFITWYRADWWIVLAVAVLGASGAVFGEIKKWKFVDDDFTIQIIPAILLLILWQGMLVMGIDILPAKLILPL